MFDFSRPKYSILKLDNYFLLKIFISICVINSISTYFLDLFCLLPHLIAMVFCWVVVDIFFVGLLWIFLLGLLSFSCHVLLLSSIWGCYCSTRRVMLYCTSPLVHEVAEASQQKTNKEPPQLHHQIQCDRVSDLGSEKEISGLINVCRCGGSVLSCIFTNQIIMLYILGTYNWPPCDW